MKKRSSIFCNFKFSLRRFLNSSFLIKKAALLFAASFSLSLFSACKGDDNGSEIPPPPDEGGKLNWQLVYQEDFNGTAVDVSEWSMYNGPGHVNNGLRRPEAFSVQDGLLIVTAEMKDGQLVSGGMAHRKNYKYGRFEFRVRTDADPSAATSGVVLTWPESGKWPDDGELDIYETLTGSSRNPFHTYIHYGANNSQAHFEHKADGKEWHIVMLEWLPDVLRVYRDGSLVYTLDNILAVPQVKHHLCIQLDAFKTVMTGQVKMYVDWVKIYQQEN
jgi:beta-glucanase (GH16 family)